MRRVLQVEIDEKYFDQYGAAFFKSFYYHNKGWKLFVVDLGLRDDQREILAKYGDVVKYERDPHRRWGQLSARIKAWCDIMKSCDVMLRLDVDAVVLGNFDNEFREMVDGGYDIGGQKGRHPNLANSVRCRREAEAMLGIEEGSTLFDEQIQIHAGWIIMRNTEPMIDVLNWLRDNWDEYNIYTTEEESALGGLVFSRGLKFKYFAITDCPGLNRNNEYIVPCVRPPSRFFSGPAKYCHFAFSKYYTNNSAAGLTRETYMAWQDTIIEPYAKLPWPDPESACGC
jgi:hypothetical protein